MVRFLSSFFVCSMVLIVLFVVVCCGVFLRMWMVFELGLVSLSSMLSVVVLLVLFGLSSVMIFLCWMDRLILVMVCMWWLLELKWWVMVFSLSIMGLVVGEVGVGCVMVCVVGLFMEELFMFLVLFCSDDGVGGWCYFFDMIVVMLKGLVCWEEGFL